MFDVPDVVRGVDVPAKTVDDVIKEVFDWDDQVAGEMVRLSCG